MSPAMLSVLVKMMLAQAQECVFEKISLAGIRNEFFALVKVAQEAAKVRLPGLAAPGAEQDMLELQVLCKQEAPPWLLLTHDLGSVPAPAGAAAALRVLGGRQYS